MAISVADMRREPQLHPQERSIERSRELFERARRVIPDAAQTNSKRPERFVLGVSPTHAARAEGSHFWDVDGNEYIDYLMACGPVILGYDHPAVMDAVTEQVSDGSMYSLPHPLAVDVAETITEIVPCAEMVRFGKNGNDVTALSAKLARAYTGRNVIATAGYHGWPDVFLSASDAARGIPSGVSEYTERFGYNDLESARRIFEDSDDVAAIITTPASARTPDDGFLEGLRELADEHGALLVFDEVFTGFRFALGGAQERFGVTPDVACFAKAMANGYPISAVAGRRDVMKTIEESGFTFSMTYAGEAVSLAATKACLDVLQSNEEEIYDRIYAVGDAIREGFNDLAAAHGIDDRASASGIAPRVVTRFTDEAGTPDPDARSLFLQEAHKRGVFVPGSHIPSAAHSDADVEYTLAVYDEVLAILAAAIERDDVADRVEGQG